MDIGIVIGIITVCLTALGILCAYLWHLSDKISNLTERVVKLETIWNLKLAEMGRDLTKSNESINNQMEEK